MITTFYSYKGGVGRSMAMANVAYELAGRGLRVLAIDFDLEAPGLERYFRVPVATVHASLGVIDCIDSYKRALSGSGSIGEEAEFRQLRRRYVCEIARFGARGALDLMPAGRRLTDDDKRAYALAVRTFDWQDFYFNWEGEAFFEWLRRTLVGGGEGAGLYDVVLADSRTGVTEMGGVCACQLADVVVMLSAANHQNIDGTRELAQDLDSPAVKTLRRNRKPLSIVVVPARVEQRAPERLADFVKRFDAAFDAYQPSGFEPFGLRFHELALPYVPEFAFEEQVTDRASDEGRTLTDRFKRLADALLVLSDSPALADAREQASANLRQRDRGARQEPERAYDATRRHAGYDAYLSVSTRDRAVADRVISELSGPPWRLRCQASAAADFGSARDLPPGTAELLNHAEALVLMVGAEGVLPWQREEVKLARSVPRPPRVLQLLLPGASDDALLLAFGSTLADAPLIDLRREPEAALRLLAEALHRADPAAQTTQAPASAQALQAAPFRGPLPYRESDAALFFGRDAERDALVNVLREGRRALLRGRSGVGKTSLVLAGLFPALRSQSGFGSLLHIDLGAQAARGADVWRDLGAQPADTLLVLDHVDESPELDAVLALWRAPEGPKLLLVWRAAPLAAAEAEATRLWREQGADARVDRSHALHHRCGFGAAGDALLAATADAPGLTLDSGVGSLRHVVETALARTGRRAEEGLLERLFADAGPKPAMAAVQRVLAALWADQRRGFLTNEAYDRLGGIDEVVGKAYEQVIASFAAADLEVRDLLLPRWVRAERLGLQPRAMSWARECSIPAAGGRAAWVTERLAREGLLVIEAAGHDVQIGPAHLPRDPQAFEAMRGRTAAWREPVLKIADAYAHWAVGEPFDDAEAAIEDASLDQLAARLALGEAAFAAGVQQRARRRKLGISAALVGLVLVVVLGAVWNRTIARQNEQERHRAEAAARAASEAESAKRDLAIQAARAQQGNADLSLGAGPSPRPDPKPAPARTRVVVHRTGGDEGDELAARQFARRLAENRFEVDERIEAVAAQVCGDVRFHHEADRRAAARAQGLLNDALKSDGDPRRLELNDRTATRAAVPANEGVVEVWLPPMTTAAAEREDRYGRWRLVNAGCAVLGSDDKGRSTLASGLNAPPRDWYASELPLQKRWLPAFYIGKTEVTMAQFAEYQRNCQRMTGEACPPWQPRFIDPKADPQRPAVWVSWAQASAYCRWAGGRLPTDAEWEKAARGPEGRFWPWGDKPDDALFQGAASPQKHPLPVDSFAGGRSPYGVADMAGNVWELTADPWKPGATTHSMRGGSYLNSLMESRASSRWTTQREDSGADYLGFRCVRDLKPA